MLSELHRAFLSRRRVGHLATADAAGVPHLVPVCFALGRRTLYTPIDDKPKSGRELRRLNNIARNPRVAFLADHYDEDWSKLGWLRLDGVAEVLSGGDALARPKLLLAARYRQYRQMRIERVIAVRIGGVRAWGDLDT